MKYKLILMLAVILLVAGCIQEGTGNSDIEDDSEEQMDEDSGDDSSGNVKVIRASDSNDDEPEQADDQEEDNDFSVACHKDSECGTKEYGDSFCWQGDVSQPVIEYECVNAGTVNSRCKTNKKDMIKQCQPDVEFCSNGACLVISKQPCEDSDGGKNYEEYGEVLDGRLKRTDDSCLDDDKTLFEAYCDEDKIGKIQKYTCDGECRNGACVE